MARTIDKEAILDLLIKHKDTVFVGGLLCVLLLGGLFLYLQSAQSVNDIIRDLITDDSRRPAKETSSTVSVSADDVVSKLLVKRPKEMYDARRNPFGSPEDQLKMRQEVEAAYQKGVELLTGGQYDAAIQQFDKVIALDVTETRIQYAVSPSEYRRRAVRENAKKNLDRILQTAQSDMQEGERLVGSGKTKEALAAYARAGKNLSDVIGADQDGGAIGKDNLNKLKQLQQQTDSKLLETRRGMLLQDLNQGVTQGQQALAASDFMEMLKALNNLVRIQAEITSVDPNSQLVQRNNLDALNQLVAQIQTKLKDNFAALLSQADQLFTQAIGAGDTQKSQLAILGLRQAMMFAPEDNQQDLFKKINECVARRAELVVQKCTQFYTQQKALFDKKQFDQFDQTELVKYLRDLGELKSVGSTLPATVRNQLAGLETQLKSLKVPTPVTDLYEITAVTPVPNLGYKIEFVDKSKAATGRKSEVMLREGRTDTRTQLTLKRVDTGGGFVILSHPEHTDVKVNLASTSAK